jgi:osmotically inducible lipoprotein OsmB
MTNTMKPIRAGLLLAALLALTACDNLDQQQQRMLTGGAAGAAVGTVGTVMTGGCVPCGAAIGGAVGVGAGYVVDQMDKNKNSGQ